MAEERLARHWRLELRVLTPLHVGAGGPRLLHDYDFVVHDGQVFVIDLDRAYARLSDEELAGGVDARLGRLLRPADYPAVARYRLPLRGGQTPAELLPLARDVEDRPYLPGSSVKGALRTALAWAWLKQQRGVPQDVLLTAGQKEWTGQRLERQIFGRDPNHDLLRALRVGDLRLEGEAAPELTTVGLYSLQGHELRSKGEGFRWHVEALPAGARLVGDLSVDGYLVPRQAEERQAAAEGRRLPADEITSVERRDLLGKLAAHCRDFAAALLEHEERFYRAVGQVRLADWHARRRAELNGASARTFLLQLGWGTGWTAKTVGLALRSDPRLAEVIARYGLDRGRNAGVFPKTRRLVERGGTPEAPPGWVCARLTPRGGG